MLQFGRCASRGNAPSVRPSFALLAIRMFLLTRCFSPAVLVSLVFIRYLVSFSISLRLFLLLCLFVHLVFCLGHHFLSCRLSLISQIGSGAEYRLGFFRDFTVGAFASI